MLQNRNEKIPEIWKAGAFDNRQGKRPHACSVKRPPDALVIEHLKGKIIASEREPEFEEKAAHFGCRQTGECRFRIQSVPFASRRDEHPAEQSSFHDHPKAMDWFAVALQVGREIVLNADEAVGPKAQIVSVDPHVRVHVNAIEPHGDTPARCRDEEIGKLFMRADPDGIIRLNPLRSSRRRMAVGTRVIIADGPLKGFEGLYLGQSARDRERVLLEVLGAKRPVELARGSAVPV